MPGVAIHGLGMRLPVVDHGVVADVEANSIIRGREEFVITGLLGHEIACPANREMIDRLVRSKAAFSPVEVDVLVRAHQNRIAAQILIVEIFSLQAALSAGRSDKFGVVKYFVERRFVNRI